MLNTSGGTVASEPMTVGAYKPAAPLSNLNGFNGYISGNTLTVTSIAAGNRATFTGSLGYPTKTFSGSIPNGSSVLTVSGNPSPNVGTVLIGSVNQRDKHPGEHLHHGEWKRDGQRRNLCPQLEEQHRSPSETNRPGDYRPAGACLSPTLLSVSGVTGTITNGMLITDGGAASTVQSPPHHRRQRDDLDGRAQL